jgi:hypothetical protein
MCVFSSGVIAVESTLRATGGTLAEPQFRMCCFYKHHSTGTAARAPQILLSLVAA